VDPLENNELTYMWEDAMKEANKDQMNLNRENTEELDK